MPTRLREVISRIPGFFPPAECAKYFRAAGYDAT
jgi:hypothetical protein